MVQFTGSFTHTVDSQRRVAIPKNWRDDSSEFYLIPGFGGRIHVIPGDLFQRVWQPKLEQASMGGRELSDAVEAIGKKTHHCTCDKQGRISLTEYLMEYAGLTDHVHLNGMFSMFRMVGSDPVEREDDAFGTAMKLLEQMKEGS